MSSSSSSSRSLGKTAAPTHFQMYHRNAKTVVVHVPPLPVGELLQKVVYIGCCFQTLQGRQSWQYRAVLLVSCLPSPYEPTYSIQSKHTRPRCVRQLLNSVAVKMRFIASQPLPHSITHTYPSISLMMPDVTVLFSHSLLFLHSNAIPYYICTQGWIILSTFRAHPGHSLLFFSPSKPIHLNM